jgi:hypothetical protein
MAFGQDSLCHGVMPRRRIRKALRRVLTRQRELSLARRGSEPNVLSSLKRKTWFPSAQPKDHPVPARRLRLYLMGASPSPGHKAWSGNDRLK